MKLQKYYVFYCLVTGIISFALGYFISDLSKEEYAYVDMDRIIIKVTKSVRDIGTKEGITHEVDRIRNELLYEIDEYAKRHNVVIFSSPKPIAGAIDRTEYFLSKVKK